jgi:hypothetical protein
MVGSARIHLADLSGKREVAMRTMKLLLLTMLLTAGALASEGASARGAHFGVWIGGPVWGPWYYPYYPYPYYYYPPAPVIVAPPAPTVYIDNGSAAEPAAPAPSNYWYYCRNPQGYYPYVKECSGNWEKVPPQPAAR